MSGMYWWWQTAFIADFLRLGHLPMFENVIACFFFTISIFSCS